MPKRQREGAQERPKAPQERPSCAQDRPKRLPNPSKNELGGHQSNFVAPLVWAAPFERLLERFFVVCCVVRVAGEVCSDPIKLWFCYITSIWTAQARKHAKTWKNMVVEAPKLRKSSPERLKIVVGAFKNAKKTADRANKRSKTRKMRLRRAQERKKRQHGPNMERFGPAWGDTGPSPKHVRTGFPKEKSAALLAAPGVSNTIAFFLRKPCSEMLRGGHRRPKTLSEIFQVGSMLAPCWLVLHILVAFALKSHS